VVLEQAFPSLGTTEACSQIDDDQSRPTTASPSCCNAANNWFALPGHDWTTWNLYEAHAIISTAAP
jgi:hypothetical protein